MPVTIDQFKNDLAKYFRLSETEDILISIDGKVVAVLSNPNRDKLEIAKSLIGSLPNDGYTEKTAKKERLSRV